MDVPNFFAPYFLAFYGCVALAFLCWLLSVVTREYSWVDRIWSISPPGYAVYVAWSADFSDARINIMAGLMMLWGARLTFNFARKGGYQPGGEDYRWKKVQEDIGPRKFALLNATFIAPYQNVLLYLLVAPIHIAWLHQDVALTFWDVALACIFLFLLIIETIADEQMWRFQEDKKRKRQRGEAIEEPFYRRGLYRFSRHPNYFCEVAMWWTLYGFAIASSGEVLSWTIAGAVLLNLLFHASTNLTEKITLDKYPEYAAYQRSVSRLIPFLKRRG